MGCDGKWAVQKEGLVQGIDVGVGAGGELNPTLPRANIAFVSTIIFTNAKGLVRAMSPKTTTAKWWLK